jgi:hypothetical protein
MAGTAESAESALFPIPDKRADFNVPTVCLRPYLL